MANKKQKKTSKVKTIFISLLSLVIGVLAGFVLASFFATTRLEFNVVGKNVKNIGLDSEYVEEGVTCIFDDVDQSVNVKIEYYDGEGNKVNSIDTSKLGTYLVKYVYKSNGIETSITRVVNIVEMEDLSIHFMMLGNKSTGDSIYIKAGDTDVLVDAGSTEGSVEAISSYLDAYVTDDKLEYVIATHADKDHIAAFPGEDGIFSRYEIDTIIDFPLTDKTSKLYASYREEVNKLAEEGTKHYTALECYNNENGATRVIELAVGIEIEILYNYYYENKSADENNYSVCFMLRRGDEEFLFTGDLEKDGEEHLVENNELDEVYLYKAGHHGSKTSSTLTLLNVVKPEVVVCTCVAFTGQYTDDTDNIFPTKQAIENFNAAGVKHLYVPAMATYINIWSRI